MPKLFGSDDVNIKSENSKLKLFGGFSWWWPRQTQKLGHSRLSDRFQIFRDY